MPILLDRNHQITERYSITNIPTVVWLDEENRVVRPNTAAPGTDTFIEFTGVSGEPHKEAVREWVRNGTVELSDDESAGIPGLDDEEIEARLHYRLALVARRAGNDATALEHFNAASALAPHDFTIRRSAMPLTGGDPFGAEFFELWEEWEAGGRKYQGFSV